MTGDGSNDDILLREKQTIPVVMAGRSKRQIANR